MATITYPVGALFDDAGALLTAPVVVVTSVTDKAGGAIGTPGATVNGSATATPISVDYDAETKGEAWITLGVSQAGRTLTGVNAAPSLYAAKDSSRITTSLPVPAAGAVNGLPLGDASGRVLLQPAQAGVTIPTVTTATNLTNAPTAGDFTAVMKTSLNASTPVATVSDKTGFSLSGAGIQGIWDALLANLTTVGSIGKKFRDWVLGSDNKSVLSNDAQPVVPALLNTNDEGVLTSLNAMIAANAFTIGALINAPSGSGGGLTAAGVRAAIGMATSNLDTQLANLPAGTLAAIKADPDWKTILADVNGVWDYNETTHVLTLQDKTGGIVRATLTLTPGTNAYTHRASS